MGPPLNSWRKEVRVYRNGIPCCTEMLTQVAEKEPKWTIPGRAKDPEAAATPGPGHVPPVDKYPRAPGYSFPRSKERPSSAPPGRGFMKPKLDPTTPKYSFGTNPRPPAFPGEPGPGPGKACPPPGGPKYSIRLKPPDRNQGLGPGPAFKPPISFDKHGPRYGKERPQRPRSAGPGPTYRPKLDPGKSYSMQPRRPDHDDGNWRPLGPQWTYFGYNDFGHSECVNCEDIVNPLTGELWGIVSHERAKMSRLRESQSFSSPHLDQSQGGVKKLRRQRPSSAPNLRQS